jgi:CRISPR-associated Cas5-like protein
MRDAADQPSCVSRIWRSLSYELRVRVSKVALVALFADTDHSDDERDTEPLLSPAAVVGAAVFGACACAALLRRRCRADDAGPLDGVELAHLPRVATAAAAAPRACVRLLSGTAGSGTRSDDYFEEKRALTPGT